jgi:probable F420-dependent oxidoreductase
VGSQSALVISQIVVLDTDAARAREAARGTLRFLSGVRGYRASFARMGFSSTDIARLSDELVDQLVAWGSAGAIAARINQHLQAGADQVVLSMLGNGHHSALGPARELALNLLS